MQNLRKLTVANAFYFVALGIGSPLVNIYFQGLGASFAWISVILVLLVLTSIITSTVYARYANRFGPRRYWLVAGLTAQATAYLILSYTSSLAVATVARILEGAGLGL
jgi:MFS family permease